MNFWFPEHFVRRLIRAFDVDLSVSSLITTFKGSAAADIIFALSAIIYRCSSPCSKSIVTLVRYRRVVRRFSTIQIKKSIRPPKIWENLRTLQHANYFLCYYRQYECIRSKVPFEVEGETRKRKWNTFAQEEVGGSVGSREFGDLESFKFFNWNFNFSLGTDLNRKLSEVLCHKILLL